MSAIGHLAHASESALASDGLSKQLHELKHQGPSVVLHAVERFRDQHPEAEDLRTKVFSLQKRESRMQSPPYQAAGWPIGSGMVESGKKVIRQARMKGPGMPWEPAHVNPLLALRTSACHDRWDQATASAHTHLHQQRLELRRARQHQRYERLLRPLLVRILLLRSRAPPPAPSPVSPPTSSGPSRPSAPHPWRKPLLAKK